MRNINFYKENVFLIKENLILLNVISKINLVVNNRRKPY